MATNELYAPTDLGPVIANVHESPDDWSHPVQDDGADPLGLARNVTVEPTASVSVQLGDAGVDLDCVLVKFCGHRASLRLRPPECNPQPPTYARGPLGRLAPLVAVVRCSLPFYR